GSVSGRHCRCLKGGGGKAKTRAALDRPCKALLGLFFRFSIQPIETVDKIPDRVLCIMAFGFCLFHLLVQDFLLCFLAPLMYDECGIPHNFDDRLLDIDRRDANCFFFFYWHFLSP